ncbi:FtsW/RodA/SpoVE family cell cycle protein [Paenibacillus dendritiformis]|uniref:FtsW/RodA/SpoVE family cell cycle protein n=1 Tax=Paenibacillus dendritiformis TaxID=130049 RepID=UPI00105A1176|nr:FtsW/RodA/SpoVE family cell cycle protein [Paenibacillus dendritiformis]TDL50849.1 rod shape-determining protein RodA [Paenibacillus dendritiformis]WGU97415.1 FtsW/RodA/SpoVE family cell cycle protein [Paenibacillus dendritiformis]
MLNKLKRIDWVIVGILLVFSVFSPLVIYSATHGGDPSFANTAMKTVIFFAAGFVVMFATALFDYRILLKIWPITLGVTVLLLVGIFFFGSNLNGAIGWYNIGAFSFQPAEIAKIALIFALAQLLGRRGGDPLTFTKDLVPVALVTLVPFTLVVVQPDLGNAIIYIVIFIGMLWIGGIKLRHVLIGLVAVSLLAGSVYVSFTTFREETKAFFTDVVKHQHWFTRIDTFINPSLASDDANHQSKYAMIAIGSGGLSGDGYMKGELKRRSFIPYTYSDAIFVVIGEEFGFQGSSILLLLYFLLIYRMILIAFQCYDLRGSYIIIGVVSMFVFQILENIGMMIGLMPVTGITLPFISYGGTSLLINMFCIGLVMSIRIYQEKYQLED